MALHTAFHSTSTPSRQPYYSDAAPMLSPCPRTVPHRPLLPSNRAAAHGVRRARAAAKDAAVANGGIASDSFLDSVKWDAAGLVTVIAQDVDTGEVLMQAFTDRAGLQETLQTRLATFYSRSRRERWCKGETSGNFIRVSGVFLDCDRDSVIYLGAPDGPSCHTGAESCWYTEAAMSDAGTVLEAQDQPGRRHSPESSVLALEGIIRQRRADSEANTGGKPSWTARLLADPGLLCAKVREEAGELCETLERGEGGGRAASEMADLLYHSMVLLNAQGVSWKEVCGELRSRFARSGIEEKASRAPKAPGS